MDTNKNKRTRLKSFIGGLAIGLVAGTLIGFIASAFLFGSLLLAHYEKLGYLKPITTNQVLLNNN